MKTCLDNFVVKYYSLPASIELGTLGRFGSDVNNKIGVRREALGLRKHMGTREIFRLQRSVFRVAYETYLARIRTDGFNLSACALHLSLNGAPRVTTAEEVPRITNIGS